MWKIGRYVVPSVFLGSFVALLILRETTGNRYFSIPAILIVISVPIISVCVSIWSVLMTYRMPNIYKKGSKSARYPLIRESITAFALWFVLLSASNLIEDYSIKIAIIFSSLAVSAGSWIIYKILSHQTFYNLSPSGKPSDPTSARLATSEELQQRGLIDEG